ncbi:TetR/AcrR family transcriptional regulator [Mycolicibacterium boenickei]|uniref:TetR family transcriptional regulator n=1 Tax=Mycolicibacterium boenickei TaxID=146017 RepID=A0AAX2ZYQ2_9MYCO|nr:TetR family transcriptional regulator [Mycolicibacterium boenickei]UNC00270.1 TetR/AcrR family transcriptional regulator [Mycolicibacterium boenickei]BBX90003.1 TetR family transcriptional regulator [Mycolicibacterium boenickei]
MIDDIRRRPGGRSERVRRAVAEATLGVIAEKGIADFTVSDVAARSGVHETSIYRRWGNRENLITETLLGYSEQVIPVPDTGALDTDLRGLLEGIATYLSGPVGRALAQALAFSGEESRWAAVRREFWSGRLELVRAIIDRAVDRGELPAGTDPRLVLETLVAPLSFRTLVTRQPIDDGLCTRLVELVLAGILPRDPIASAAGGKQ